MQINYKNLKGDIPLHDRFNIVIGKGKTNLIEALYIVSSPFNPTWFKVVNEMRFGEQLELSAKDLIRFMCPIGSQNEFSIGDYKFKGFSDGSLTVKGKVIRETQRKETFQFFIENGKIVSDTRLLNNDRVAILSPSYQTISAIDAYSEIVPNGNRNALIDALTYYDNNIFDVNILSGGLYVTMSNRSIQHINTLGIKDRFVIEALLAMQACDMVLIDNVDLSVADTVFLRMYNKQFKAKVVITTNQRHGGWISSDNQSFIDLDMIGQGQQE